MTAASRAAGRARRRRRLVPLLLFVAAFVAVVLLLFAVGPLATHPDQPGKPPLGYLREPLGGREYRVTAWSLGGLASLEAASAAGAVDEIDFDWYHAQADGSVTAANEDLNLVATARERELNLFATVTNSADASGAFSRPLAAAILASAEVRRRFIDNLVALAEAKRYDGIDLDWEGLKAADRDGFSVLVEELAAALHARGRFLSVAVAAKTSEPGQWDDQKFVDWARVGKAVDEFKIMTYSYSGPWSEPGPQAPLDWVDQVLSFAETVVRPAKISMGVPFFGFDWYGSSAAAMSAHRGATLAARYAEGRGRDPDSKEATLRFTVDGVAHEAVFQDDVALAAKLAALRVRHPSIAGISIWVMGQEAKGFWPLITEKLRAPAAQ